MPVRTCIRCGFTTELISVVEGRGAPRLQGWPRNRKGKLEKRCFSCQAETADLRLRRQENEALKTNGQRRCVGCSEIRGVEDFNRRGDGSPDRCRSCRSNDQIPRRESYRAASLTWTKLAKVRSAASRCAYCSEELEAGDTHVDHIVPLSRGGSSRPENLAVVCGPCNRSKHTKSLDEWMAERGLARAG